MEYSIIFIFNTRFPGKIYQKFINYKTSKLLGSIFPSVDFSIQRGEKLCEMSC